MSKCKDCQVRLKKMKSKLSADCIGGLAFLVGAGFYCLNILNAYLAGDIVGVSLAWALFFVFLNGIYTYIFYQQKLPWSMWGSGALTLVEGIYAAQVFYYM